MIISGKRYEARRAVERSTALRTTRAASIVALAIVTAAICLTPVTARAADPFVAPVVDMVVQPRASQLIVRLHVPATALLDARLPRLDDGRLDPAAAEAPLRIVAGDVARNLDMRQDDRPLDPPLAAARVAADQRSVDVALTYVISPGAAGISARLNAFRAELQPVRTQVRYLPPSGAPQDLGISGPPARVLFDPGPADALGEVVPRALRALFDGGGQLVFLLCLLVPLRKARTAAMLVATVAIGQTATMALSAGGLAWTGERLAVAEMAAASVVLVAALQNIVRARTRWVAPAAIAFGLLNGLTLGSRFAGAAPFAGAHDVLAFAAFLPVVQLGQLWLGATLWATRSWLDSRGVPEPIVAILVSVAIAHDAVHRVMDRGQLLTQWSTPAAERALVWLTLAWIVVMLAVALANTLTDRAASPSGGFTARERASG